MTEAAFTVEAMRHAEQHGIAGPLEPHPHLHGDEPGQHRHHSIDPIVTVYGRPVLTGAEERVVQLLADAWNLLAREVVEDGPTRDADLAELAAHVHVLQNAVLAQAAGRIYPGRYRRLGGTLRT